MWWKWKVVDDCASRTKELVVSKNSIAILINEITKAESEALRQYEEQKTELNILKKQIKAQNNGIESREKEANCHKKHIKEREKETLRLQGENENLELNIKRLKSENAEIRNKNKRSVKENKKKGLHSGSEPSMNTMTNNNNNSLLPLSSTTFPSSLFTPCLTVVPTLSPHKTPSSPLVDNVDMSSPVTNPATVAIAQPGSTPSRSPRLSLFLQAGPRSPVAPPGFPKCTESSHDASIEIQITLMKIVQNQLLQYKLN